MGIKVNACSLNQLRAFGQALPGSERRQIGEAIEEYRAGTLPLMAPVSLLRFLFTQHGLDWPLAQVYLAPFPKELTVRSGGQ